MPNLTTNYSFYQPLVNDATDQDLWGGYLNSNWGSIDTLLNTATNSETSAQTTAYTITTSDRNKVITGDASGGAFTVTLPPAATAGDGFKVTVKKIDSSTNAVTIDGDASETIDGQATYALSAQYDSVTILSDGSNWLTIGVAAVPDASDTTKGLIEIATSAEVTAASSTTLAVTPGRMADHFGVAKAIVTFSSSGAISSQQGDIDSVSKGSTGTYTVTLGTTYSNIYAAVSMSPNDPSRTNAYTVNAFQASGTTVTVQV